MNKRDIYCNNCGMKGHIYKDCKLPVISCGNIIYRLDGDKPKILMIQRKDSLCYIEFIRGKYDIYNNQYIQVLIDKFTVNEKQGILTKTYDELWKELWLIGADDNDFKSVNDYQKGYDKFNKLSVGYLFNKTKEFINLHYFVKKSKTNYLHTEWEFPKGRRNNRETNLECAKREFTEETNYTNSDYSLINNIAPFTEEFMGENRVRYKYIYYIGYLINMEKEVFIDPTNKDQFNELKDIRWMTLPESLDIIRNYHHTRKNVILKIFSLIDSIVKKEYILIK
tara:strand:- start:689 stop:1531 length:843 start_codon:yes stop_codon:yes gene_type:complete